MTWWLVKHWPQVIRSRTGRTFTSCWFESLQFMRHMFKPETQHGTWHTHIQSHVTSSECREEEEPPVKVKVFRLVLTVTSRGRKREAWGWWVISNIHVIHSYYFTVTDSESVFYTWTVERRRFRMNFCQSINSLTQLWSAESNTLNLQLSQVTVTTGKQCRRVDSVIFEETLSLHTWLHCVCWSSESVTVFFLSDWRWVVMRRKRRTEQSLQGSAVCLWRVTGPLIVLQASVMNLDPHTQSKRPATNMWTSKLNPQRMNQWMMCSE